MLIRNARVWPPSASLAVEASLANLPLTDVRLTSGRIADCAPGLRPAPGEPDTDADGGTLLPGLHDHHVHLPALAAARTSVAAGPPRTRTIADLAARLRAADAELPPGAWLRAVGYHESVAGPWTDGFSTGCYRTAPYGFSTGPARCGSSTPQHLHCMAPPGTGQRAGKISLGPVKILLDDTALPLGDLADRVRAAHAAGRPAAVHCVTRVPLVLTLAALDAAGRPPDDRIEHGAVIPAESLPDLRGLTIVTQPHFVAERGEQYLSDVTPDDLPYLWRLRSLVDAGVSVAGGSDAPFGNQDVWAILRAAVRRPPLFRPEEAVSPVQALSLFLGEPSWPSRQRFVATGQPADVVLLRAGPLEALDSLASDLVAVTFVDGEVSYARGTGTSSRSGGSAPRRSNRLPAGRPAWSTWPAGTPTVP
jgi:hypothetical protein